MEERPDPLAPEPLGLRYGLLFLKSVGDEEEGNPDPRKSESEAEEDLATAATDARAVVSVC